MGHPANEESPRWLMPLGDPYVTPGYRPPSTTPIP
jgi:hypothetical protein